MALQKIRLGTQENGQPLFHYHQDDPAVPVVVTGPISGYAVVTHPDGTAFRYDVSEPVIEVFPGHELYVAEEIGRRQEAEGHPLHNDDAPFVHTRTEFTHQGGEPSEAFAEAVGVLAGPDGDSSPRGVMSHLRSHRGQG